MFWGWTCPGFPNVAMFVLAISLAVAWSMAWKGVALWRAGRNAHLAWFVCLFIFNTLGILEIVYIFAFSRVKPASQAGEIEAGGG